MQKFNNNFLLSLPLIRPILPILPIPPININKNLLSLPLIRPILPILPIPPIKINFKNPSSFQKFSLHLCHEPKNTPKYEKVPCLIPLSNACVCPACADIHFQHV